MKCTLAKCPYSNKSRCCQECKSEHTCKQNCKTIGFCKFKDVDKRPEISFDEATIIVSEIYRQAFDDLVELYTGDFPSGLKYLRLERDDLKELTKRRMTTECERILRKNPFRLEMDTSKLITLAREKAAELLKGD